MSHYVLNLLPLKEEERPAFQAALPDAVHVYAGRRTVTQQQLAQTTILMGWPRPEDLSRASQLQWFHSMFAGMDEYLAPGVVAAGVTLTSSAGTNSQSVSEHMLASLLALCRKLPQARDQQRQHLWQDVGQMRTISGATVLIVGAGHIGQDFARLCKALGGHTVGLRRTVAPPPDGLDELRPMGELDQWLPQADVVALCLPQTADTIGLLDRRRIGLLRPGAILLSAGRGTVLDQDALCDALEGGHLWGAALDVTDPEPLPPDHRLWDAPDLLLTPHVAGGLRLSVTRDNCARFALAQLQRFADGRSLLNLVRQGAL